MAGSRELVAKMRGEASIHHFQQSVLDADDFRVNVDVTVSVPLYGPVALSWALLYKYNSVVAAAVEPGDLRTTFGITWRGRYEQ